MWLSYGVDAFLKKHTIDTDGAMNNYEVKRELVNDGDEYTKLEFPFWSNNKSVVRGVIAMLWDLGNYGEYHVYIRPAVVEVHLYHSVCDPD